MGRKSLQIQRRAEILDACEAIALEEGLAAATATRVAGRVGIDRTTVHHYFHTQADLLGGLVERIIDSFLVEDQKTEAKLGPGAEVGDLLDFMMTPAFSVPHYDRLLDELAAAAHHDDEVDRQLCRLHRALEDSVITLLLQALPEVPPERVREFAYTFHPLIEGVQTLQAYGIPEDRLRAAQRAARKMLKDLLNEMT
jgi:AcrR family transcriptional regulator